MSGIQIIVLLIGGHFGIVIFYHPTGKSPDF